MKDSIRRHRRGSVQDVSFCIITHQIAAVNRKMEKFAKIVGKNGENIRQGRRVFLNMEITAKESVVTETGDRES